VVFADKKRKSTTGVAESRKLERFVDEYGVFGGHGSLRLTILAATSIGLFVSTPDKNILFLADELLPTQEQEIKSHFNSGGTGVPPLAVAPARLPIAPVLPFGPCQDCLEKKELEKILGSLFYLILLLLL
jgi:hypothetical protein